MTSATVPDGGPRRRTKVVATLADATTGPAGEAAVAQLIAAGADLVRIDLAAGIDAPTLAATCSAVRAAAHEARTPVGIVADGGDLAPAEVRELLTLPGPANDTPAGPDYLAAPRDAAAAFLAELAALPPATGAPVVLARIDAAASPAEVALALGGAGGLLVERGGAGGDGAPSLAELVRAARDAAAPVLVALTPARADSGSGLDAATASWITSSCRARADALVAFDAAAGNGTEPAVLAAIASAAGSADGDADTVRTAIDVAAGSATLTDDRRAAVHAALALAEQQNAALIVALPSVAAQICAALSSARPEAIVVGAADDLRAMWRLSAHWGVLPRFVRPDERADAPDVIARRVASQLGIGAPGGCGVVIGTAGAPEPGTAIAVTAAPLG